MLKVLPRPLIKHAQCSCYVRLDDVLRAIGGAGVRNFPVVDKGQHAVEAMPDDVCLVFHGHAQAICGSLGGRGKLQKFELKNNQKNNYLQKMRI